MPKPSEHKTVQARLLRYAQEIGWTFVPQMEAERRRHFDPDAGTPKEAARNASLFFDDVLYAKACELNPKYKDAEGALVGGFRRLHADIYGNREFLAALRNQGKSLSADEVRELDLVLLDYSDLDQPPASRRNVYEVTEEFTVNNGRYCNREDVVFLINGIPVLAVECKNASKSEAIPLGYKAFLVAVDRPACHKYKAALDQILPPEYSAVIMTTNNNDGPELKQYHLDDKAEKTLRKNFRKFGEFPKILIVTEKLLTGYDAPILYSMYLDKPMRDHTLLQAIARVNRPYENEQQEMVKPHGFVLDFIGIFENLEKALQFDSEEINAIVKDLSLLKQVFKAKMESVAPEYLKLIHFQFDDRDNDNLIEHFRDKERRKKFFKEYKEIEMLYEIVSPDAFLRPYLDDYATLSGIYAVVRKAFSRGPQPDKDFQRKTNQLIQAHIATGVIQPVRDIFAIDEKTIEAIQNRDGGDNAKVINLIKSIEKIAEEQSGDPYLIAMADRARAVQESFEDRQTDTAEALSELFQEIKRNENRKRLQVESGLDSLTYYVLCKLTEEQIPNARSVSENIAAAFRESVNWRRSEKELRELRNNITFAIYSEVDDLDRVVSLVDSLFEVLIKAGSPHAETH